MSGTRIGGRTAAETNKKRHGQDFYVRIGAMGGAAGHTGGFAANSELARKAGAIGGRASRRTTGARYRERLVEKKNLIISMRQDKTSYADIGRSLGVSYGSLISFCRKEGI